MIFGLCLAQRRDLPAFVGHFELHNVGVCSIRLSEIASILAGCVLSFDQFSYFDVAIPVCFIYLVCKVDEINVKNFSDMLIQFNWNPNSIMLLCPIIYGLIGCKVSV